MHFFTDVDVEKPDERSILTYLATLYDKLEADRDKSPKRAASPTKTSSKKSSPSQETSGRTLSPEPGHQPTQLKKSTSKTTLSMKGGEGKTEASSSTPPVKQSRSVSPSGVSLRRQRDQSRSPSPTKGKDHRTPSPTSPSGNARSRGSQSKLSGTPSVSPSSSLSEESMEVSSSETSLATSKRREARSTSPTPKSSAPKKPRISVGKTASSSDHSDRLKNKRLSLSSDSKKPGSSSYYGDRKRSSFSGSLTSLRKLSSTLPTPMDLESSSSEEEESQVSVRKLVERFSFAFTANAKRQTTGCCLS